MQRRHDHDDHGHGHDDHGHDDHGHGHDDHDHGHEGSWWRSLLRPHSHDTAATAHDVLAAGDGAMRALLISLVGLTVTALLQVGVVLISGSVALLADTMHNAADALTAVPLALAFWVGRRPPTRRYTYGFGRAEDMAGIFIVVTIACSAAFAGWHAVDRLLHPVPIRHVWWVVAAGLVGMVGNELVAVYRIRVGRRLGSAAMVADGRHAQSDALASLAVVLGALGVAAGWQAADAVVGLLVTVAILVVLGSAARDVWGRLMDSVDPAVVEQIEQVLGDVPGVHGVDAVRVRWVGHELVAEVDIVADCTLTVKDAHAIAEAGQHRLLHDVARLARATIHVNPCEHDGESHHDLTAHHMNRTR